MILIISLDILAISIVVGMTVTKGFERTLPVVAFLLILFPNESQLRVPGLFDLTTQRLIIITVGMLYVAFGRGSSEGSQKAKLPLKYLIAIQIVWMAVSTANSAVFSVSLKTVLSQMLDYFFVFYLFARAISRVEMVYKILYSLVVAMVICSIFGAAQAYTGWSVISLFPTLPGRFGSPAGSLLDRGIRVQSTFGHPILFGGALAMA
ncbi:MAG TPA: hypothetical protein VKV79_00605, partial [Terriglobia bacterium]|nr:hypothetical protein [Terriglobia bacterium]